MTRKRNQLTCHCGAYDFPHRWEADYCSADCPDARGMPQRDADEPAGCTMPGRSNFDSDADYWAARGAR